LHAKFIDIEVNDFGKVIGYKVKMGQLSYHVVLLGLLSHNLFYATDLPTLQADFDAVRMVWRFGKNVFDNALG
jgi:hypothetical protein